MHRVFSNPFKTSAVDGGKCPKIRGIRIMSHKSFEGKRSSNVSLMRIDHVFFTDLERLFDDSKEGMQRKRLEDNLYGFPRKSRCCLRICRDDNNAKR